MAGLADRSIPLLTEYPLNVVFALCIGAWLLKHITG